MNLLEVEQILTEMFQEPLTHDRDRHIVFWYDEAGDFITEIEHLSLKNVRIWRFSENNLFATKYELEVNDRTSHFLLYTNHQKPVPQEDWLYNLYKLGSEFTADKITIFMRKLGLEDDRLRPIFMEYGQFFKSNARFESFRKYPVEKYTEQIIDLIVLSTLSKSPLHTIDEIVKAIFTHEQNGTHDAWAQIQKYGKEEKFWDIVRTHYGYTYPEKSLTSLLTCFMMTYITEQNVDIVYPKTWLEYVSPRPTNIVVFMNQWMNHREDREVFNTLSDKVSEHMRVEMFIREWDVHELVAFDGFHIFDERIINFIIDQLMNNVGQFADYELLIKQRRKKQWYEEYLNEYETLFQAIQFFTLMKEINYHIPEDNADTLFRMYTTKFYQLDAYYRKFYVAYDRLQSKESFRPLREKVENSYTYDYVQELAIAWTNALMKEQDKGWFHPGIQRQMDFYNDSVKPYIDNDQRIFVIISDAFRYEIAQELNQLLNNERKGAATLEGLQGVLPSYTALGMASLLPHQQLTLDETAQVSVDGMRTAGIKNRRAILQKYVPESIALSAKDVHAMNRTELRSACAGLKVIYIYHNAIDAVGDNPATEMDVFQSAEEAIHEINGLINRLVNTLSAASILITADHGFLYQRDKMALNQLIPQQIEESLYASRRFVVSRQKQQSEGTLLYPMDELINERSTFVTVPKGVNRFHLQGAGANFVHGGAMLQEIVIPLITFKHDRSKKPDNIVRHVDVKLTSPVRKITHTETYVEFFQTVAVGDKILPLELQAYFVDETGKAISNRCHLIADVRSVEAYERSWKEKFIFQSIHYDRQKQYRLLLEKLDGTLYDSYSFTIDIITYD